MSEPDDGGPAFPAEEFDRVFYSGMSLRDYFAGQALIGLMHRYPEHRTMLVGQAYEISDAMLRERRKK